MGSILALASQLNLSVVAEGIETDAQSDTLAALGCILGQGYHFARPMEYGDLLELLQVGGKK